ncbi:orofacial cleft 1 candidate gene 1 protein homolog [Petaurus breviceps papuanus]|uniref:orofacial cleft 1 candidate gene 1 protein homolog n=1 Tax=Petaurus breviceps papuanus TaxID=3040969 RepID=UPI0036DBD4C0
MPCQDVYESEKFQQKAPKQTKQKKSKSAEFLMAKEDGAATEGIENPAFNISSTDLSAYQTSEEKVIKHDKPDSTLAAHPQKLRLQACAEPRGNEYSRNYFDPLMDEEINPRQCGMGVSREVLVQMDEKLLYDELMKLLDEEDNKDDPQAGVMKEDILISERPESTSQNCELHKDDENGMIPHYIEQFERDAQANIILLGRSSMEQNSKCEKEEVLQESTHMSYTRAISQLMDIGQKKIVATFGNATDVPAESKKITSPCCKDERSQEPHHIQIQLKCLRGIKDKVPKGSYFLEVSVLNRLGNCALHWSKTEQPRNGTRLISHDGNFYDVGIYFNQSLYMVSKASSYFKVIFSRCSWDIFAYANITFE